MEFRTSDQLDKFLPAWLKVQSQMPGMPKKGYNPHTKSNYHRLDDVIDAALPILIKEGFALLQIPCSKENGSQGVLTTIYHVSSGQYIQYGIFIQPARAGSQEVGSIHTYFRRYGVSAPLCLITEVDDDGHASTPAREERQAPVKSQEVRYDYNQPTQPAPKAPNPPAAAAKPDLRPNPAKAGEPTYNPTEGAISVKQAGRLYLIGNKAGWDKNELRDYVSLAYNYPSIEAIHWRDYKKICEFVESNSPDSALKNLGLERAGDDRNEPPPITDDEIPFG